MYRSAPLSFALLAAMFFLAGPAAAHAQIAADSIAVEVIPPDSVRVRAVSLIRLGQEQLNNGDPELARKTLEKARDLAPKDPRVHLGIGRCHLMRRESRILLFQALERLFHRDNVHQAIGSLRKAVELAPDWWEAHYWLGTAYMRLFDQSETGKALQHMTRAYELGGMRGDIILKLAVLNKAVGDLENADRILRQAEEQQVAGGEPLVELELARINFYRGKFTDGLRFYWRGVEDITTRSQMKAFFNDVVVLADKEEQERFESLNPQEAPEFFRTFWYSRDHDLGLTPGIRIIQHYQRMQEADSLFSVPFLRRNPSLHPSMGYVPEDGLRYDDRGVIFLRHGRPHQVIRYGGEHLHPNETWVYYREEGDDLILNFVALKGSHEYQLVTSLSAAVQNFRGILSGAGRTGPEESIRIGAMTDLYSSRMEIGRGVYARLASDPYDPFIHLDEYELNIVSLRTALTQESVPFPYADQLESSYDLVEFRGERNDKSTLEFYSGVPGREIVAHNTGDGFEFDIKSQVAIYDSEWRQVDWLEQIDRHTTTIDPRDLEDRQVVGLGRLQLDPGDYNYFVRIENGGAVGIFNGRISVGAYRPDSLQSSDILTARNIFASPADSGKFLRHGLEVQPQPSRKFHPSQKLYAYQEIYNLEPDNEGNCNYRITYSMALVERDRNVIGRIYDSFKTLVGSGPGDEKVIMTVEKHQVPKVGDLVTEDVAIDISETDNGMYELSIRIEDLNRPGRSFLRKTRFYVDD